jgi:ankyrin repeat protein
LGDPAPKARNSAEYALVPNQEKLHALVEGTPRRDGSSKCSVDLRFEARGVQTRDGSYPLHMAIMELAPTEVLDMLINAAPEVLSLTNKHDETPLHVAIIHGLDDITMEFLINKCPGHAFEIRDRVDGNLPIHLAIIHDYKIGTLLQILTRYPYAVRIRNNEGCLPMDLAKDADVVDLLLVSDEAYDKEPVEVEENFVDTDSSFDGDEKPHRYDIAIE